MSYEDRISIATPEGLQVDLVLAGIGSRFIAALIDGLLQGASLVALLFVSVVLSQAGDPGAVGVALVGIIFFLILFGYHIGFETWGSGQTPGKRWTSLRVVTRTGSPVGFTPSAVRNLVRLVDFLPSLYGVGVITMLANSRNQRLGDIAAGTLVVREPRRPEAVQPLVNQPLANQPLVNQPSQPLQAPSSQPAPSHWALWDVSAVSAEEVATVRRFLDRRATLTPQARYQLAWELATRLRPKVTGPPDWIHPEDFLAELANIKAARG